MNFRVRFLLGLLIKTFSMTKLHKRRVLNALIPAFVSFKLGLTDQGGFEMRLLVVDLGELRQGYVDWQMFVENLLDAGVETLVLLNATQHAAAGAPTLFGNGVLPRDGVTRVWADNPVLLVDEALREQGECWHWAWSRSDHRNATDYGVAVIQMGWIRRVWCRPFSSGNGIHVFDVGRHVVVVPTLSGRGEVPSVELIENTHDYLHGQLKPMFMLPPEQWLYRLRDYDWVRCDDLAQQRVQSMGDEIPVVVDYDAAIVSIEPWRPLLDTPLKTSLINSLD